MDNKIANASSAAAEEDCTTNANYTVVWLGSCGPVPIFPTLSEVLTYFSCIILFA